MGWWNTSIYGGDAPLDWRENIYNKLGAVEYDEKDELKPVDVDVLVKNIDEVTKMIDEAGTDDKDKNIGYQVLGSIIMHSGFNIEAHSELKKRIILAAQEDEYSREDSERKVVMKNFKKLIEEYTPSSPIDVTAVNVYEPVEDDNLISKEFKQVFGLMNSRIKKLERSKDEKSGVEEYDKGFSDASDEEIEFLRDFMELMSKMEMMGVLFEKIEEGISGDSSSNSREETRRDENKYAAIPSGAIYTKEVDHSSISKKSSSPGKGKDILPG